MPVKEGMSPCYVNNLFCCPASVGQHFLLSAVFMPQKLPCIFRYLVGLVFLLSGLLKAIDTSAFADLMSEYGVFWFGFAAPIVIFVEIFLGIMLIFNFYSKHISWATTMFLLAVSSIYLYGVLAQGITNCGCFGPLTWLNSKPWLTFIRNGIMFAMLLPTLLLPQEKGPLITIPAVVFMAVIAVIVMFMCGFSMRGAKCLQKQDTFHPIALDESPLSEYITTHKDSTYLIFAFSYSCPYCLNSIGNVNQYVPMGMADRVIGLAVQDSVTRERFNRLFDTDFEIHEISAMQMYRLSNTMPTTYLIRHDTIISQYTGMVVSPALLLP